MAAEGFVALVVFAGVINVLFWRFFMIPVLEVELFLVVFFFVVVAADVIFSFFSVLSRSSILFFDKEMEGADEDSLSFVVVFVDWWNNDNDDDEEEEPLPVSLDTFDAFIAVLLFVCLSCTVVVDDEPEEDRSFDFVSDVAVFLIDDDDDDDVDFGIL
jgi:hypothetical protein